MNSQTAADRSSNPMRSIRSFVHRSGKITPAQKRALDKDWCHWGVEFSQKHLHWDDLYRRAAPVVLEIGFGNGQSLTEMAIASPQYNFFGIEVHPPGVGRLLLQIEEHELRNIRISRHDAAEVVRHQVANNSVDRVQVFFPDPWPKTRHHKRRLLQAGFVRELARILKPHGILHVATDWPNYAEHVLLTCDTEPLLRNTVGSYADRPEYRPVTKYEARGQRLEHPIFDIIFRKA